MKNLYDSKTMSDYTKDNTLLQSILIDGTLLAKHCEKTYDCPTLHIEVYEYNHNKYYVEYDCVYWYYIKNLDSPDERYVVLDFKYEV